ncbi:MAG: flagellar motor switch protein FliN [Phycisphaerales bacterium]|nr:flagellar motor switch protein FliN [Phycisphaerae bacterium]MCH2152017.1 flagellar motor switch protein FliN [Phycisphaerales bacterium]
MADHINPQSNSDAQELPNTPAVDAAAESVPVETERVQNAEAMANQAMKQVQEAADRLQMSTMQRQASGVSTPELDGPVVAGVSGSDLSMLSDVHLAMTVELGRTRMLVDDVLGLESGAVVELDKAAGDPVDVLVNGRPVARGEVLVLDDTFCIRISEILSTTDLNHGDLPSG